MLSFSLIDQRHCLSNEILPVIRRRKVGSYEPMILVHLKGKELDRDGTTSSKVVAVARLSLLLLLLANFRCYTEADSVHVPASKNGCVFGVASECGGDGNNFFYIFHM